MEEKILIKSERYDVKKVFQAMVIIGIILSVLMFLITVFDEMNYYDSRYEYFLKRHGADGCWDYRNNNGCYICEMFIEETRSSYAFNNALDADVMIIYLIPAVALTLIGCMIYYGLRSYELIVTDKRIYGKIAFGKRVDLPVDSISATATIRMLRGVSVSTSSGKISFRAIKNAEEIYKVISNLLIERQQNKGNATIAVTPQISDEADQLKKYKDLLDSGVITQEEFDAKKKQLLGL